MDLTGFDHRIDDLPPSYFEQVEAWRIQPRSQVVDYDGAPSLRSFTHDVITVERIEKSSYTLYWQDDGFRARRDYLYVEGE